MYLLRGTVASLAAFFLVYAVLSGLLYCVWWKSERKHSTRSARTLYAIRVFPLLGACGLVAFFTVPSFLWLEPYSINERVGAGAFAMAAAGAIVLLAGFLNSARAWAKTSRFVAACLAHSRRLETTNGICTYQVPDEEPMLFVGGIWRPKVLVSTGAIALLDADEMHAAVQHELSHVNCGDNFKKLVLHFCPLPLLDSLEREWLKATEMAADDAAADDERTALDLASALIKMKRTSSRTTMPEFGMGLVSQNGASVSARVHKLLSGRHSPAKNDRGFWWLLLASAVFAISLNYAWALTQMHKITELLIR